MARQKWLQTLILDIIVPKPKDKEKRDIKLEKEKEKFTL